jgi:large subunit ribosomal protein L13
MSQRTPVSSRESALAQREWKIVDAEGRPLGRLATQVASLLRGKHKPSFSPHLDCGDFVIVVNASKLRLTGKKATDKIYHRHTNFPGGLRAETAGQLLEERPERMVRIAVEGMLPKNRLSRRLITKLKVYRDAEHPHAAQKPTPAVARS